jgi:hypothetical protein
VVKLNEDPFIYSNCVHLHHQKHVNVTEPILWIHWLKVNHNGNKCLSTFHPYLGITRWLVTTGKASRMFWFCLGFYKIHSVQEFCYDLAWEMTAISLSLCGWQAVRVCICVSFLSCRDVGLFSIICSFLHTWPSVQWLSLVHQWWTRWIGGLSASC